MVEIILNQVFASKVGRPELVQSLHRLVLLAAQHDTGGANAAAQVILSCYNGQDYPLDVAQLGRLDPDHLEDAMNVIRLRAELNHEPHEFYAAGDRLFNQIADKWGMRPAHYDPV